MVKRSIVRNRSGRGPGKRGRKSRARIPKKYRKKSYRRDSKLLKKYKNKNSKNRRRTKRMRGGSSRSPSRSRRSEPETEPEPEPEGDCVLTPEEKESALEKQEEDLGINRLREILLSSHELQFEPHNMVNIHKFIKNHADKHFKNHEKDGFSKGRFVTFILHIGESVFTSEDREILESLFYMIDGDGDGLITAEEIAFFISTEKYTKEIDEMRVFGRDRDGNPFIGGNDCHYLKWLTSDDSKKPLKHARRDLLKKAIARGAIKSNGEGTYEVIAKVDRRENDRISKMLKGAESGGSDGRGMLGRCTSPTQSFFSVCD